MKLITKEIERKIPALYSTDGQEVKNIAVKFFNPCGAATWYVFEGDKQEDGDWLFFGRADLFGDGGEMGYFTLNELASVRLPFGLTIERDMHFDGRMDLQGNLV